MAVTIDGTNGINDIVLGSSTPAAATVTTFTSNGIDDNADAVAITIDSSEQVGIGTTAPAKRIHIESSSAAALRTIRLAYDGTYYNDLVQGGAAGLQFNAVGGLLHTWAHNGTEIMRLNATGLGIGTAAPATNLHVFENTNNGAINNLALLDAGNQNPSVAGSGVSLDFRSNSGNSYFGGVGGYSDGTNYVAGLWGGAAASGAPDLAVTSAGNVGIGTASPSTKLHVAGDVTVTGDISANNFAGRNRIINGAMVIDQRNAGASSTVTNSVSYSLDRYRVVALGTSLGFSSVRSATAPADFSQSYLATVTSAKSVAATDQTRIDQFIEGYNVADLNFGTADAKTITLSFWVRSSITGTYCVHIGNSTSPSRSFLAEYTISSADTFEYKTITISGDTTGTWTTVNGVGLGVSFVLGMGSNFTGSAGWQAGEKFQTSNQTQWIGTSGATFYITGVQIEKSSTATEFEHRNFGEELALCQRYLQSSWSQGSAIGSAISSTANAVQQSWGSSNSTGIAGQSFVLPVAMRVIPTFVTYDLALTTGKVTTMNSGAGLTNDVTVNQNYTTTNAFQVRMFGNAVFGIVFAYTLSAEL